jgi:STE24 endopeptidase
VFIIAPEILRRVLPTQPLPDSPLRRRLENLCRRNGLRYRDILLWHTENNMGNAAVMGIIPRVRYILLSDLLLETMTDDQIEAVFAHEVGHIVHRHMSWYVVFILILTMLLAGPGAVVAGWLEGWQLPRWMPLELLMTLIGAGAFLLAFGYLSRRFERQADVFAARSVRPSAPAQASPGVAHASPSPADCVNPHGAAIFSSALQRVAAINNIPVTAPSWCHGSIANRMTYLRSICQDPQRTALFDRSMRRVYTLLLAALLLLGAWIAVELYQDRRQAMANPPVPVQAR